MKQHNNIKIKVSYDSQTRKTKCKHCKQILDRDVNASRNIAYLALISLKKKSEAKQRQLATPTQPQLRLSNPDLESINNAINGNRPATLSHQPVKSTENLNETTIDECKL